MAEDTPPKRLPGRPKTRPDLARLNTMIDARTVRALREERDQTGVSMARLIEQAVMAWLPHRFDRDD